jgi:hypothetical protein
MEFRGDGEAERGERGSHAVDVKVLSTAVHVPERVGRRSVSGDHSFINPLDFFREYILSFHFSSTSIAKMAESTPKASDHNSNYPHPSLSLPHPTLSLDFRMSVTLNPRISVGPTPLGHRNWISFTGGRWSGSWGSGIVLVHPTHRSY